MLRNCNKKVTGGKERKRALTFLLLAGSAPRRDNCQATLSPKNSHILVTAAPGTVKGALVLVFAYGFMG